MSVTAPFASDTRPVRSVVFFAKNTHLGGAELALLSLMKHLRASGLPLYLITGERGTLHPKFQELCSSLVTASLPYSRKPSSWLHVPQFYRQLLQLKKRLSSPIDCVANDFYETFATLLAARVLGASRTLGFWQSAYNFNSHEDSQKWTRYGGDRLNFRLASGPVASHLNALRRTGQSIVPFNPLVDESRFCAASYNRAEIRSRLSWEHTHQGIVVGRIGDTKGQMALARAFLNARKANDARIKNLRLCIVGPASTDDRRSLEILRKESAGSIEYLGERSDIPELLTASDVALFPGSIPESFGLAIHEAMLIGTPVLALENEGAVRIHFKDSPDSLCESLTVMIDKWATLATTPSAYALPKINRQLIVKKYGKESFAGQISAVFVDPVEANLRDVNADGSPVPHVSS